MNIVFAANNIYAKYLATTITSILVNSHPSDEFRFYVMSDDMTTKSKEKLSTLKRIKNFEIEFIEINMSDFANCPEMAHLKIQTYFRFQIPYFIQKPKALYLDCDILVRKSLKELYNIDITDYSAAIVEDLYSGKKSGNKKMISLLETENYFNAGVLLMNLDKMRKEDFEKNCFDFVQQHPEKLISCDQDAINVILEHSVKYISPIFNFQFNFNNNLSEKYYQEHKKDIVVMHFTAIRKPWNYFNRFIKYSIEYFNYAYRTPWKNEFNKDIIKVIIKTIIKLIKEIPCNKLPITIKYIIMQYFKDV